MRDWGTYRKLYDSLSPDFERLPYAARCFSADILRRGDRVGRIVPGTELNEKLVADLAFHVRAHTAETEFLRAALEVLLTDGYLVFRSGYLTIADHEQYLSDRPSISEGLRRAVLARDGMVCGLCGGPIYDRSGLHIDHVLPVSRGGRTNVDNLQPAHACCNISKGNRIST